MNIKITFLTLKRQRSIQIKQIRKNEKNGQSWWVVWDGSKCIYVTPTPLSCSDMNPRGCMMLVSLL